MASTFANHPIDDSDSEDDLDYVPEGGVDGSSSDSEGSDAEGPSAKRLKTAVEGEGDPEESRQKEEQARTSAWESFKSSITSAPLKSSAEGEKAPVKMVKIEKKYRFAGEDVIKVVEVPEDSKEAKAWTALRNVSEGTDSASSPATPIEPLPTTLPTSQNANYITPKGDVLTPTVVASEMPSALSIRTDDSSLLAPPRTSSASSLPSALASTSITTSSTNKDTKSATPSSNSQPTKTINKPPPRPRASGGGLKALLNAKPKKLSTLDKSRLDWESHLDASGKDTRDELEANRRGGGYIEKVEFLGRVAGRMEDALENSKGGKRKR